MPRFYFDVHDGFGTLDHEGHECVDVAAAQKLAVKFAGELVQNNAKTLWSVGELDLEVSDEHRLTLFRISIIATIARLR